MLRLCNIFFILSSNRIIKEFYHIKLEIKKPWYIHA